MKAIILAAGLGTRLDTLTTHKPKCMARVCGKSILEYQLESYYKSGVNEIVIVTGYKSNVIDKYIENSFIDNIKIINNIDYQITNNMYSLWLCKDILLSSDYTFVSNGDVVFDKSIISNCK